MRRFSYVLIVCSCLFLLTAGYYFSYQLGNSGTSEIQPSQLRETEQILQPSYLVRIVDGKVVIQHPGRFCLRGHGDFPKRVFRCLSVKKSRRNIG